MRVKLLHSSHKQVLSLPVSDRSFGGLRCSHLTPSSGCGKKWKGEEYDSAGYLASCRAERTGHSKWH